MQGTLTQLVHHSAALAQHNPWGDPTAREVIVYEPADATGPMPMLLALPAFTSSHWGFLNWSWRSENLPMRLERLRREHDLPPVRIAMMDAMTHLGGGQFLDSPGMGLYGTWMRQELIPWLGERFPTTGFGAFGKSSGGYGAFRLALDQPGLLGAIAAHAPDCGFDYVYPPDFPSAVESLRDAGGVQAWLNDWASRGHVKGPDHAVANTLAMACCYSPEPQADPPCALPVDLETGETLPEVMERWKAHDLVELVKQRPEALQGTALYLDVGRRDEFRLQVGGRQLKRAIEGAGLELEYREHTGGHFKLNSRFEFSLPWMIRALS